jgi:carboxyl-terminal processing protease
VLSSWELRDGSSLLLGFAYWLTPDGRMIRDNGIVPDVAVEMPPDVLPLTPDREADLSLDEIAARDVQLGAALQILQGGTPTTPSAEGS